MSSTPSDPILPRPKSVGLSSDSYQRPSSSSDSYQRFSSSEMFGQNDAFQPARTHLLAILQLPLLLFNEIQALGGWFSPKTRYVLCQVLVVVVFAFSYVLLRREHTNMRYRGYLKFYVTANMWARNYIFGTSLSFCFIFLLYTFIANEKSRDSCLAVFVTVQVLSLSILILLYVRFVRRFNEEQGLPDAKAWQNSSQMSEENLSNSTPDTSASSATSTPLFQKQAMMIRHFEKQVRTLKGDIQRAQGQTKFSNAAARRSELEALLAAKERDLRTLQEDRDRIRGEVNTLKEDTEKLHKDFTQITQQHKQSVEELERCRENLRQLQQDRSQLGVLLEVHKQQNAEMRELVNKLSSENGPQGISDDGDLGDGNHLV